MGTPRLNPNDPKWTAYVLGELDEADVQTVERLLEASPEARALIEELRSATNAIEEALAAESTPLLTTAQRAAIRREADAQTSRWFVTPMRWGWAAAAIAAGLVIAVALQPAEMPAIPGGGLTSTRGPGAQVPDTLTGSTSTPRVATDQGQLPDQPPAAVARNTPPVTADALRQADAAPAKTRLTGSTRDTSGAVLPGVTITATNSTSNAVVGATVTDAMGRYAFDNLDSGEYKLTATLPGFQVASADLSAANTDTRQQDFTMTVGALTEAITVAGDTAVAQRAARADLPPAALAVPFAPAAGPAGRGGGVAAGNVYSLPTTQPPRNTESYARVDEAGFVRASREPLATFSIDVDTASYSNVRRFLTQNQLPPADAVRIEELINYFTYDYPRPSGSHPIGTSMAVAAAPWNTRNRLLRIGVKAREIEAARRPPSNLVFLIDVSGSMNTPQKLPLVKSGLKMLVDQLGENDAISIVVYAGASGLVLPPTRGDQKSVIARAIDDLEPGGSTNGAAGIQLAYSQATAGFIRGGSNRVILMTDGDFNVGVTSQGELSRLIEERARSGVFLSVLGFGMGNLKDSTLEKLADTGNGHYAYIDSLSEARKVLVEQMSGTLVTVAKDVKIQVDFNPAKVEAYRLIGYENRALRPEDFNNDLKDAGDMGAGHTVTALFEIVPRGGTVPGPSIDPSVFQPAAPRNPAPAATSNDMLVLRVRYKLPDAAASTRMDVPLPDRTATFASTDADFRFAAAVAAFGMVLRDSPYRGDATLTWVLDAAAASRGQDRGGYRAEFISLVQRAIALQGRR